MAYSRGAYSKRSSLPVRANTRLVGSRSIDYETQRYQIDTDGNSRAMRDTAQRVQLLVAFATSNAATGNLDLRSQTRLRRRVEAALQILINEGAIRDLRVQIVTTGVGRQRVDVRYFDVLRSVPRYQFLGPNWYDQSWTAGTPGSDGTLTLAPWMSYTCATSSTTAQTSAATLKTGFAADAPRGYSRDGSTYALLVEPSATNIFDGGNDLTAYTPTGSPVISSATGPDGSTGNYEIADDDGGTAERMSDTTGSAISAGNYALSVWRDKLDAGGTTSSIQPIAGGAFFSPGMNVDTATVSGGWEFATSSSAGNTSTGALQIRVVPAASPASATGSLRVWGIQVENRLYATSYHATARAVGSLALESERLMPRGFFDLAFVIAPPFAQSAFSTEWDLVHFDGADHRLYFDGSDDKIKLLINGTTVESSALTWTAHDVLTVRATHLPSGLALTVSGADAGDGSASADAVGPIAVPASIYLGGDSSGCQQSCPVRSIASYATAA